MRRFEGAQTGGDRVVTAWFDLNVVRRIGVHQVDGRAVEEAVDIFRLAAVATQQAVFTEQPNIAWLRDRLIGRLGYVVGIALAAIRYFQQASEFLGGEACEVEVEVQLLQSGKFFHEAVVVPLG